MPMTSNASCNRVARTSFSKLSHGSAGIWTLKEADLKSGSLLVMSRDLGASVVPVVELVLYHKALFRRNRVPIDAPQELRTLAREHGP